MEKQEIVGVKFNGENTGKIYYFSPNGQKCLLEQKVIVETSHGLSYGFVAIPNKFIDANELVEPLKKVVRIANEKDLKTIQRLKEKESNAVLEAKKTSEKLKLDMNIIDAEYAFDESKVTISFTSDGRVDFRELVKLLASSLKTRIELRQVGIRDKAKILGGIGPCGREVCCKRFLTDFEKVNIKMAKNQGISLTPNNINGICGRLMCCLSYENEQYVELIKLMPSLNSKVKTKDGEGTVVYNNLLKKLVSVKIYKDSENYEILDYPLEEIVVLEDKKQVQNNHNEQNDQNSNDDREE